MAPLDAPSRFQRPTPEPGTSPLGPTCQNDWYRRCGKRGLKLPSAPARHNRRSTATRASGKPPLPILRPRHAHRCSCTACRRVACHRPIIGWGRFHLRCHRITKRRPDFHEVMIRSPPARRRMESVSKILLESPERAHWGLLVRMTSIGGAENAA